MSKKTFKQVSGPKVRQYTPVVVYFGTIGIGFISYLIARFALGASPHPIHWASGIAGALFGYFASWAWYRWRGDII